MEFPNPSNLAKSINEPHLRCFSHQPLSAEQIVPTALSAFASQGARVLDSEVPGPTLSPVFYHPSVCSSRWRQAGVSDPSSCPPPASRASAIKLVIYAADMASYRYNSHVSSMSTSTARRKSSSNQTLFLQRKWRGGAGESCHEAVCFSLSLHFAPL